MRYVFIIMGMIIALSIQLIAVENIQAGNNCILVKDVNNSIYWKGSYKTSFWDKNITSDFEKVFDSTNHIELNNNTFLAIDNNGVLHGFGWNFANSFAGLLGNGSNEVVTSPIKIKLEEPLKYIRTNGSSDTIAITKDGNVYIWGDSVNGELGIEGAQETTVPIKIDTLSNIKDVATGYFFSLALDKNGNIYGWGNNYNGQIAQDEQKIYNTPTKIETPVSFSKIVACGWSAGAIDNDGNVYSWGSNVNGVLGQGDNSSQIHTPTKIKGLKNIVKLSCEQSHMLALDSNGNVYSWGSNDNGELGDGTTDSSDTPKKLNLSDIIDIAEGNGISLALSKDGTLYGWGSNENSLITDENITKVLSPTVIHTPFKIKTDFSEKKPDTITLSLKKGWNLIGLPNAIKKTPKELFSNYILWEYKNGQWRLSSDCGCDLSKYAKVDMLEPGNGFWVKLNQDTTLKFDKFDYDLNATNAVKKSFGWSLLASGQDSNVSDLLNNGLISFKDRKVVFKYVSGDWQYFTQDKNISDMLSSNYKSFNGEIHAGEGFWVYSDSYLYDYRYFGGTFHAPAYDKNMTTFVSPSLSVIDLKNNYIADVKTKPIYKQYFGDYTIDDKGEFIYITSISTQHEGEVTIVKNDQNLTKYSPYISDGDIWNIKYQNGKLAIIHSGEVEFVDTSNAPDLVKDFSIPCSSGRYKMIPNHIISIFKDGDTSYLEIFDQNGSFIKKYKIVDGDSIDFTKIIIKNDTIYLGYFGYKKYGDEKTYLSGMVILNLKNNEFKNKVFGDMSLLPFYVQGDKIYLSKQDKYGGGLKIIDNNFNIIKEYTFPQMILSFRKKYVTKNGYILTITSKQGKNGYVISLFDKELNLINEIDTNSYDDYNIALDENGYILLFPDEFSSDFIARLLQIKNGKLILIGTKQLKASSFFIKTSDKSAVFIDGDKFEVVDIDKFLNTFNKN